MKHSHPEEEMLFGVNAVVETLLSGRRRVHEVYLVRGRKSRSVSEVERAAARRGVPVRDVEGPWMASRFHSREDQGVAARVDPYPYTALASLLAEVSPPALLLALDQVQDPRNLGAAVRSAAAFGASGVVIHKDRASLVTPAAVKASAGMTEHVPVARVTNLVRALDASKKAGIWIRGMESGSGRTLFEEDLTVPTMIVVGGEDSGLRRLTKERCDSILSIPLDAKCRSLNAAAAATVALGEASRQRGKGP